MANYLICLILQRFLWPIVIVACSFMRPVGISFVYLLMFFISPFIPIATSKNIKGVLAAYFIVWISLSTLVLISHIGLQIAIFVLGFDNLIGSCSFTEILLRHIGFINLMNLEPLAIIEWIVPEALTFLISVALYIILKKIVNYTSQAELSKNEVSADSQIEEGLKKYASKRDETLSNSLKQKLRVIGPFVSLATLFVAAVLRPSIPGGFYFIVFLGCGTYWACWKKLERGFAVIMQITMVVLVLHTIAIFSYQTPWPQQLLSNSSLPARLTALEPLFISNCVNGNDIRIISFNGSVYFDSYLGPISMLLCYYILALTSKTLISKKVLTQHERSSGPTENTPLVRKNTRNKKLKGSKTENIALDTLSESTSQDQVQATVLDEVMLGLQSCGNFLYTNSYVFTSIIMMVWSIVYHSWLTFVLLIWANILWMIPNQRKTMLRSSPFIVFYAELLLIAQYIYGMDLTDDELPISVEVKGINLRQIGFEKPLKYPCAPLMLKTFFTLMFWITMRQLFKEAKENKRSTTLADMVAPLQITVGAATADLAPQKTEISKSRFLDRVGEVFKSVLVKLWIWLLVSVIFLCGITGQRMTGFRICYMALFLFFVLAFQLSWKSWTKIMYGYWLVLIVYAMTILILIYTYQFDRFENYWKHYIGIDEELQKDIGLERYKTKELFLHLVNPTAIVVMTVIQVHYFHDKFLASLILPKSSVIKIDHSKPEERNNDAGEGPSRQLSAEDDEPIQETDKKGKNLLFKHVSRRHVDALVNTSRAASKSFLEFFWIFLEIHLMKIILVVAFWCCLTNVCVLHISFAFLAVIAVVSKSTVQIFISRLISVIMSILLLSKMIYQVDYINHKNYDAVCDENNTASLIHINNAEWFGLSKLTAYIGLATLLKGYIIYMIVVTLHSVVVFRQEHRRTENGAGSQSPKVIFEGVKRLDAEVDLIGLVKFLFNYAYYKFGFEITLIALVAVISYRQDLLAIIYTIWLCTLFKLRRSFCAKLWPTFQSFVAIILILQYILFVGLPPGLCTEWPWHNSPYVNGLQSWVMVPGPHLHKQTAKLMFDFILLICIYRQHRVFSLEKKFVEMNLEYPGGSNKSIVPEIDNLDITPLDNPVPDFISNVRNWLDVLKIAVLNGFFWLTLAVVFLAGTNIVSLFSVGYLIGSFVFLWQGTDFYLRPVRNILKWWYILLAYNVIVITMKTALQIGGCLFLSSLEQHACWFVHLFGVSCIQDTITETLGGLITPTSECPEIIDKSGLSWDAVCFAFLIFQLRIFKSYYFHHIINDTKASTTLASRGAELIEDLREKEIEYKKKHERDILRKLKKKMEKIRAKQEKMLRYSADRTHFDDEIVAPLAHSTSSFSSYQGSGYHTPIDDEENENIEVLISEIPSELSGFKQDSSATSLLHTRVRTSSSAFMTLSSDGYLEPRKLSIGSPLLSESQRLSSFEETFPVFSSQYDSPENEPQMDTLAPTYSSRFLVNSNETPCTPKETRNHRRQSSVNTVSWNEPVETSENNRRQQPRMQNETMESMPLKWTRSHNQHSLKSRATICEEISSELKRRRCSDLTWINRSDNVTSKASSQRPYSWGPIGTISYWESLLVGVTMPISHPECNLQQVTPGDMSKYRRKPPKTHAAAVRAGDYYMFDDLDEHIELDMLDDEDDYLGTESETNKKIARHKTLMEKDESKTDGEASSKHEDDIHKAETKELSEPEDTVAERGLLRKIWDSILVTFIVRMNRFSRNYRYVMRILGKEKKMLKESKGFGLGTRTGTGNIWTPFKYTRKFESSDDASDTLLQSASTSKEHKPEYLQKSNSMADIDINTNIDPETSATIDTYTTPREEKELKESISKKVDDDISDNEEDFIAKDHHLMIELLIAIWYAILANTDLLCYLVAFINQVASASILSLPIPLMIFLWGTLSIPRPTKSFWITLIAYTQAVVLIKCVFQFKMIWFNTVQQSNQPLTIAKIIGIQYTDGYAGYDLALLLVLFFHRFLLKSQGLWKSEYKTETVDDGAYILLDEPPRMEDIDGSSSQDVKEIALITKDDKTLILARQNPEDAVDPDEVCVHASNFIEEPGNYLPEVVKVTSAKYCSPIVGFLQDLLHKARLPTDVYAYMFLCDFINFFVLLFGFSAFDSQRADGGVQTYLEENRVPVSFLVMLVMQFILIIMDRALYLRKAIKYRLGYHLFLVIGIHGWMFFAIPSLQGIAFNSQVPTVIFYLVKCVYLILSSYQLRCGYPSRISGNFFTKGYSIMNMLSFRIYMAIPLLYELRTVLDWVCTNTTMTLFDWLKMEDIFAEIYCMKCGRQMETDLPVARGQKKPILSKIIMGGSLIFVLSFLIWGPFVIFALSSAVGISNVPYDVSISLRVGPYEPVYEMTAQDSSIHKFDTGMMDSFKSAYVKRKVASTFLSDYDHSDVAAMVLGISSASLWSISPPDKERMLEDLEKNRTLTCRFRYAISRKSYSKEHPATTSDETTFELTADHPGRPGLISMLKGQNAMVDVKLASLLPKFLKVKSNGNLKTVPQLMPVNIEYRDVEIKLFLDNSTNKNAWWQLNEFCEDAYYVNTLSKLPLAQCDSKIVIYTFSDKLFPSVLSIFTAGGIIGMYTTIVLVGSRFLRAFIMGSSRNVMFEELPYVDRVLQLCLDVYLVREAMEFKLEEDLFAKLLFLYRSPETMIKWTRPKDERADDETEETESRNSSRRRAN